MVIIPKSAKGEVATLMHEALVSITGVIDNPPPSEKGGDVVLVYWPRHRSFPEYIRLTPDFVTKVERNHLGDAIIHTQGCYNGGPYHLHDEEVRARRLLRTHLEGVGVELDDIADLSGRHSIIIDPETSEIVYKGVVLKTPPNETRAEYMLAHYIGNRLVYTNLYPDDIVSIFIQKIPVEISMYPNYGGGISFDDRTRQNAELHLKQLGIHPKKILTSKYVG